MTQPLMLYRSFAFWIILIGGMARANTHERHLGDWQATQSVASDYPSARYEQIDDSLADEIADPRLPNRIQAALADRRLDDPESWGQRVFAYRCLIALFFDNHSAWPQDWQLNELGIELIQDVPLDFKPLQDAFLDFYYLSTGEDKPFDEFVACQWMEHIGYWYARFPVENPYWLAAAELRAGSLCSQGKLRAGLQALNEIYRRIDLEREVHSNPILVCNFLCNQAVQMRRIGQDLEARRVLTQSLAWDAEIPVDIGFRVTQRYFQEDLLATVMRDLELPGPGLRRIDQLLEREGEQIRDLGWTPDFRQRQATLLLDLYLSTLANNPKQAEAYRTRLLETRATLEAIIAEPGDVARDRRNSIPQVRREFGLLVAEIEWWLNGPESALATLESVRVPRFATSTPPSPPPRTCIPPG